MSAKTKAAPGTVTDIPIDAVRFEKTLYPRIREDDAAIERYRLALDNLPPIVTARGGVLVDGFHRWQAHIREGRETIRALDLGDLDNNQILLESVKRNATHGQQLSQEDKQGLAERLWPATAHLGKGKRVQRIAELLAVDERTVQRWTKGARKAEKDALKAKAWDLWLDCENKLSISKALSLDDKTIGNWVSEKAADVGFSEFPGAPTYRPEAFDVWSFALDRDDEKSTYFGKTPRQIMENLLWGFTEPGQVVVDPFAGSGTTIRVAKAMGRRVWSSDIVPRTPMLPIHSHDIGSGWPKAAPKKADLVFLDPPYFEQARGRYPAHEKQAGDIESYADWLAWWASVVTTCAKHTTGYLAYIVSPAKMPNSGGQTLDLACDMRQACIDAGLRPVRRFVVPYTTQQATGDQVNKARESRQWLVRVRDLLVFAR